MRRVPAVLACLALLAGACDGGSSETTGTSASSSSTATTSTTTTSPTTTTTTAAPATPESAAAAGLPWWNDRVFYEVFVRSFQDSDGDGIGDLQGLIARLDYLNDGDPDTGDDLGVTGIWLMPVFESPSYHGYDVTDYRRIEPDYGTLDDFREFLDEAHERGIAVIVDLVLNHTSRRHPWFAESYAGDPDFADWYIWAEQDPGWPGPAGQQVWHPIGERWYYGLFWEGMPDLNLSNDAVTAELHDVAWFWLEEIGVDGFRIDAAKHFVEAGTRQEHTAETLAWLEAFQTSVEGTDPKALVLGEVWSPAVLAGAYVPEALDITFDFDLAEGILLALEAGNSSPIVAAMERALEHYPPSQFATFLSNHDQTRVMSRLTTERKAVVAATLLLTGPGVPFIYYGEEVGMQGRKPDPMLRTPMPWTAETPGVGFTDGEPWQPPQAGYEEANVAAGAEDPGSLLSTYRELIALRDAHPSLRYGDLLPVETGTSLVYSFLRTVGEDHVLVIANLSRVPSTGHSLDLAAGPFEDSVSVRTVVGREATAPEIGPAGGFSGYRPIAEIAPYEVIVLVLE
jgi:glycosidase